MQIDQRLLKAIQTLDPGWWYKVTWISGPTRTRKRTVSGAFQCMWHSPECEHTTIELQDLEGKVHKAPVAGIIYVTRYNKLPQSAADVQNKY